MLNALNTKILLAILAVLLAITGAVAYHRHEAAKAAQLCEQQQYQQLRQQVEKDKKRHNSSAAHEGAKPGRSICLEVRLRDGSDDTTGTGATDREFRRGLAVPVHEQSDQPHHAERRRVDAVRLERAERHRPVHAHQYGHQLEHVWDDLALSYPSSTGRRSNELYAPADSLLASAELLGESLSRSEFRPQPLFQLHCAGDGQSLRSELAQSTDPAL